MSRLQRHMSQTIRAQRKAFKCKCASTLCGSGLTQAELARVIGVPPNTVSRWETGTYWPAPYDLFNLAEYLQVPVSIFFLPQTLTKEK